MSGWFASMAQVSNLTFRPRYIWSQITNEPNNLLPNSSEKLTTEHSSAKQLHKTTKAIFWKKFFVYTTIFPIWPMPHLLTQWEGFVSYTSASHQRAIKRIFQDLLKSSSFIIFCGTLHLSTHCTILLIMPGKDQVSLSKSKAPCQIKQDVTLHPTGF